VCVYILDTIYHETNFYHFSTIV